MTGEAVALETRPASVALRGAGAAIDLTLYTIVYFAVVTGSLWILSRLQVINDLLLGSFMLFLTVLVYLIAPVTLETLTRGRSVGKFILGLRVVREDGGTIRFRHAFLRQLAWLFEVQATGGAIAAIVGICSPDSKRLGDYLAGTYAVAERAPKAVPDQVLMPPRLAAWALDADISALPAPLVRRIHLFLASAPRMRPDARLDRAVELATELNPRVAPAPPRGTHPEEFLAGVAAEHRNRELARMARNAQIGERFRARVRRRAEAAAPQGYQTAQ